MSKHDTAFAEAFSLGVLPGYLRIIAMMPKSSSAASSSTSVAASSDNAKLNFDIDSIDKSTDEFNSIDVKLVDGDPELKKTLKPSLQFETMASSDIEELCSALRKGVEEIVAYRSSRQYLQSETAIRRLKEQIEKTDNRAKSAGENDDSSRASRALAKCAIAGARANMCMLNVPTRLITHYDTIVNFCIGLGRISLATYESR